MDKKQLELLAILIRRLTHSGVTPRSEWGRGVSMVTREHFLDQAKEFMSDLESVGLEIRCIRKDQNLDS